MFDTLKAGQIVHIAATSAMGSGAGGGAYAAHKVGRRSKPTRPQWWTEAITLEAANGDKRPSFAKFKLWKDKNGRISMSHGDMGIFLKGIKL